MVEVGTTNRTRLADYERAVTGQTALLLKVHRSNFVQRGFTEEVSASSLSRLGARAGIPVMEDQGSGAILDLSRDGIPGTPSLQQVLAAGPGVVTASDVMRQVRPLGDEVDRGGELIADDGREPPQGRADDAQARDGQRELLREEGVHREVVTTYAARGADYNSVWSEGQERARDAPR